MLAFAVSRTPAPRRGGMTTPVLRVVAGVLVLAHAAPSAAADGVSLSEALARAEAMHPVLRAAAAEVDAARGRLRQAGLYPANPVIAVDVARHVAPEAEQIDRGVSLSEEIEIGGQRGLRLSASRHELAHAEQLLADRRRAVLAEVRRAYAGLQAAAERATLASQAAALASRAEEVARRRARAGDVGALDVQLARIENGRGRQAVAAAETDRARAAARLATAIGTPDQPLTVSGSDGGLAEVAPEHVLVTRALAERADLAAAKEERARLESEASLARRSGWLHNPVLRAFYREELDHERIAGGEVSVPLPLLNRNQGLDAALRASATGAAIEVERLQHEIPRQIHLALVRRAAARDAAGRYDADVLPAARAAEDAIEQAYAAGELGLPEVLVQRDRLLQTRAAAISARLELREAEADLIEAVGDDPR
jgi:cobalt-zinc-cadmium efflux system outer membrane protein